MLFYLVLVCGGKLVPRLRVIGLVPAKHTNRYGQNWNKFSGNLIHVNKALISDLESKYITSDLIPLRAALFHPCFEMMKDVQRDKTVHHPVTS